MRGQGGSRERSVSLTNIVRVAGVQVRMVVAGECGREVSGCGGNLMGPCCLEPRRVSLHLFPP